MGGRRGRGGNERRGEGEERERRVRGRRNRATGDLFSSAYQKCGKREVKVGEELKLEQDRSKRGGKGKERERGESRQG